MSSRHQVEIVITGDNLSGGSFEAVIRDLGRVDAAAARADSAARTAGGGFGAMAGNMGNVVTGVFAGTQMLTGFATTAAHTAMGILNLNGNLETTRTGFVQLTGSAREADVLLAQLRDFAADTPFEFPELSQNARMLMAFGDTAQEVLPHITIIGDTVSALGGSAQDIDRVVRALGQMEAKGKVNAEEMAQLTELGINGWALLSEQMGMSTAELMKMSEQGKLLASDALPALYAGMEKAFGGGMAAQSQNFTGLLSSLKDNLSMGLADVTKPLFDRAKLGLQELVTYTNSAGFDQKIDGWTQSAENFGRSLSNWVVTSGPGLLDTLGTAASTVGTLADAISKLPVLKTINVILKITKAVGTGIDTFHVGDPGGVVSDDDVMNVAGYQQPFDTGQQDSGGGGFWSSITNTISDGWDKAKEAVSGYDERVEAVKAGQKDWTNLTAEQLQIIENFANSAPPGPNKRIAEQILENRRIWADGIAEFQQYVHQEKAIANLVGEGYVIAAAGVTEYTTSLDQLRNQGHEQAVVNREHAETIAHLNQSYGDGAAYVASYYAGFGYGNDTLLQQTDILLKLDSAQRSLADGYQIGLQIQSTYSAQQSEYSSQLNAVQTEYDRLNEKKAAGEELNARELAFLENAPGVIERYTGGMQDAASTVADYALKNGMLMGAQDAISAQYPDLIAGSAEYNEKLKEAAIAAGLTEDEFNTLMGDGANLAGVMTGLSGHIVDLIAALRELNGTEAKPEVTADISGAETAIGTVREGFTEFGASEAEGTLSADNTLAIRATEGAQERGRDFAAEQYLASLTVDEKAAILGIDAALLKAGEFTGGSPYSAVVSVQDQATQTINNIKSMLDEIGSSTYTANVQVGYTVNEPNGPGGQFFDPGGAGSSSNAGSAGAGGTVTEMAGLSGRADAQSIVPSPQEQQATTDATQGYVDYLVSLTTLLADANRAMGDNDEEAKSLAETGSSIVDTFLKIIELEQALGTNVVAFGDHQRTNLTTLAQYTQASVVSVGESSGQYSKEYLEHVGVYASAGDSALGTMMKAVEFSRAMGSEVVQWGDWQAKNVANLKFLTEHATQSVGDSAQLFGGPYLAHTEAYAAAAEASVGVLGGTFQLLSDMGGATVTNEERIRANFAALKFLSEHAAQSVGDSAQVFRGVPAEVQAYADMTGATVTSLSDTYDLMSKLGSGRAQSFDIETFKARLAELKFISEHLAQSVSDSEQVFQGAPEDVSAYAGMVSAAAGGLGDVYSLLGDLYGEGAIVPTDSQGVRDRITALRLVSEHIASEVAASQQAFQGVPADVSAYAGMLSETSGGLADTYGLLSDMFGEGSLTPVNSDEVRDRLTALTEVSRQIGQAVSDNQQAFQGTPEEVSAYADMLSSVSGGLSDAYGLLDELSGESRDGVLSAENLGENVSLLAERSRFIADEFRKQTAGWEELPPEIGNLGSAVSASSEAMRGTRDLLNDMTGEADWMLLSQEQIAERAGFLAQSSLTMAMAFIDAANEWDGSVNPALQEYKDGAGVGLGLMGDAGSAVEALLNYGDADKRPDVAKLAPMLAADMDLIVQALEESNALWQARGAPSLAEYEEGVGGGVRMIASVGDAVESMADQSRLSAKDIGIFKANTALVIGVIPDLLAMARPARDDAAELAEIMEDIAAAMNATSAAIRAASGAGGGGGGSSSGGGGGGGGGIGGGQSNAGRSRDSGGAGTGGSVMPGAEHITVNVKNYLDMAPLHGKFQREVVRTIPAGARA